MEAKGKATITPIPNPMNNSRLGTNADILSPTNIKQYTTVNMMLAAINIGFFTYFLDHLTTKGNKHNATPIAQSMTKNDCDSLTFNRTVI